MEEIFLKSVEVKLENKDLWDKFNALGTEMVITKVGRRMFPYLEVSIKGLRADETYMIIVDMVMVDDLKYKYNDRENQWESAGSRPLSPSPVGMYLHPISCSTGRKIPLQHLSFNKVKLTNNPHTVSFGHILLESMCRYVPRLSIVTCRDYHDKNWQNSIAFMFKETEFIAVTAYMNKDITKLKIDNNPFAKAFRETGLKKKALQSYLNAERKVMISFQIDEKNTDETSSETEPPTAVNCLTNGIESCDGIQVLHVNPSSIFVTDVPPSPPSPTSFTPQVTTNSELNVVFAPVSNPATSTESQIKVSPSAALYESEEKSRPQLSPRTSLQGIPLLQNRFIYRKAIDDESASDEEWARGEVVAEDKGDEILCKVTDVRSLRTNEQEQDLSTRSLGRLKDVMDCSSTEEKDSTNKDVTYRGNCEAVDGESKNLEDNTCQKNDKNSSEGPSDSTIENIKFQDFTRGGNNSLTQEMLLDKHEKITVDYEDALTTYFDENTIGKCENLVENTEDDEEPPSSENELPGIVKERFFDRELTPKTPNTCDEVKQATKKKEYQMQSKDASCPQISRLLNLVNSVSMPVRFPGKVEKSFSSNTGVNCERSFNKSTERLVLQGLKRSVDDRLSLCPKKARLVMHSNEELKSKDISSDVLETRDQSQGSLKFKDQSEEIFESVDPSEEILKCMDQSKDILKLMDQAHENVETMDQSQGSLKSMVQSQENFETMDQSSTKILSIDQSKEMSKPTDVSNKLFCSVQNQNENLKSSSSTLISPPNNTMEDSCGKKTRHLELEVGEQGQKIKHETLKSTNEVPRTGTSVGNKEQVKRPSPKVFEKSHPQSSSYCTENLQDSTLGQKTATTLQGLKKGKSHMTADDQSHVETTSGKKELSVKQNGAAADGRTFPVILSSYSIHPWEFSKQQFINVSDEPRVNRINNENRVALVYPAENFYLQENPVKEARERDTNKNEARRQSLTEERKSECHQHDVHNGRSIFPDKIYPKYKKIIPKTLYPSNYNPPPQQEYIDLNENFSTNAITYQRQVGDTNSSYYSTKGVPLQVLYTFETRMSLSRAPDPRMPEIYNPTRTTFTGYASRLICSTLPIVTRNMGYAPVLGECHPKHRQR